MLAFLFARRQSIPPRASNWDGPCFTMSAETFTRSISPDSAFGSGVFPISPFLWTFEVAAVVVLGL